MRGARGTSRAWGESMGEGEISLTGEQVDLDKFVKDEGGIWSLRQIEKVRGWNNIEYGAGL